MSNMTKQYCFAPTVKTDPVLEAIARKLFGFAQCPPAEQAKMIKRAAKSGAEAARKQEKR